MRGHAPALFEAVYRGDVRMIQRGEYFRFALKARESVVIGRQCRGQDLDRDLALQLCVCRPVDLPHPASTDLSSDFVDAEAGAWGKGQSALDYTGGTAVRTGLLLTDAVGIRDLEGRLVEPFSATRLPVQDHRDRRRRVLLHSGDQKLPAVQGDHVLVADIALLHGAADGERE
jgi:hypothetical protein